jgi:hypothetical protein
MSDAWYYAEGDRKIGPITLAELGSILSRVGGAEKTLVWRNGFTTWIAAADVRELEAFLATPPPLPQTHTVEEELPEQPSFFLRNSWLFIAVAIVAVWAAASFYMYAYMWIIQLIMVALLLATAAFLVWKKRYYWSSAVVIGTVAGLALSQPIVQMQFNEETAVAAGFNSAADMREATTLRLTPTQLAERRAQDAKWAAEEAERKKQAELAEAACRNDWSKCSNNGDVVNKYKDWFSVQYDCKDAANRQARFGTPEWSSYFFSSYYPGDDYLKTGIATLVEKDALFQNGFGAKVHSQAICKYNLRSRSVISVVIIPR